MTNASPALRGGSGLKHIAEAVTAKHDERLGTQRSLRA